MKSLLMLSEADKKLCENFLKSYNSSAKPLRIEHILDLYLTDEEVIKYLKISKKSLYNWRADGLVSFILVRGQYRTYLPTLIDDLNSLTQKNERKIRSRKKSNEDNNSDSEH